LVDQLKINGFKNKKLFPKKNLEGIHL